MKTYRLYKGTGHVATVQVEDADGKLHLTVTAATHSLRDEIAARLKQSHDTMRGGEVLPGLFVDKVVTLRPGTVEHIESVLNDSPYRIETNAGAA